VSLGKKVPIRLPDGTELEISYTEKGSGIPVLGIHGMGGSKNNLELVFEHIPDDDMRAIAIDLPGYGVSSRLPLGSVYSIDLYADVVNAFLGALGIEKAYVVGTSMGGSVALTLTACYPERVLALVVQGAPFTAKDFPAHLELFSSAMYPASPTIQLFDPFIDKFAIMRKVLREIAPEAEALFETEGRALDIIRQNASDLDLRALIQIFYEFAIKLDLTETIKAIRVPTLLIDGDAGAFAPANTTMRIASLMAQNGNCVETRFIRGAGHLAPFTHAPEFVKEILAFFARN